MRVAETRFAVVVALSLGILTAPVVQCQTTPNPPAHDQATPVARPSGSTSDQEAFVFRVTAREVDIEFVATDKDGKFVADLQANELQVYEFRGQSEKVAQYIVGLRLVRPGDASGQSESTEPRLRLTVGGGCASRFTAHYELAYHPNAEVWKSGFHKVFLTTSRPGVKLAYRSRYYVGEMSPVNSNKERKTKGSMSELEEAACYRSDVPASIMLFAHRIQTERTDSLRYSLLVSADSLKFTTLSEEMRRVELDYGVCMFDRNGSVLESMNASSEQTLTPEEYRWSQRYGFPHLLEFAVPSNLSLVRFVVRDRATGNIGSAEAVVSTAPVDKLNAEEQIWKERLSNVAVGGASAALPVGPIGSFGSIIPDSTALCGDVYELEVMSALPDFWTLPPIAAIYTKTLDVPNQQFWNARGIPGVTRRTDWFGIDYHGTFWVRNTGDYEFRLESDDGAKLLIDDQLVIDVDGVHPAVCKEGRITLQPARHTIHVPYFQGPLGAVALVLSVKPPGASYHIFDLRDFAHTP